MGRQTQITVTAPEACMTPGTVIHLGREDLDIDLYAYVDQVLVTGDVAWVIRANDESEPKVNSNMTSRAKLVVQRGRAPGRDSIPPGTVWYTNCQWLYTVCQDWSEPLIPELSGEPTEPADEGRPVRFPALRF